MRNKKERTPTENGKGKTDKGDSDEVEKRNPKEKGQDKVYSVDGIAGEKVRGHEEVKS